MEQISDPERIADQITAFDRIADQYNESTKLSWLWALLSGPIYFAVHGFWGRAAIVLILNFMIIGFIVPPFIVYPAWRARASRKAQQALGAAAVIGAVR